MAKKRLTAAEVERMEEAADIASYRPNRDRLAAALKKHADSQAAMRKALAAAAEDDDETVWGYK